MNKNTDAADCNSSIQKETVVEFDFLSTKEVDTQGLVSMEMPGA